MPARSQSQQQAAKGLNLGVKYCLNCGKEIQMKVRRDLTRKKFCSKKCMGYYYGKKRYEENPDFFQELIKKCNSEEANKKKGHKGENHSNWKRKLLKCPNCGKEFLAKPRKDVKSGYAKFCSMKCYREYEAKGLLREKVRIIKTCLICGKEMKLAPHDAKQKFCSHRCTGIYAIETMCKQDTSIEQKVEEILKKLGVKYQKQYRIQNFTVVDFFVEPNIAIYCDGEYWHSKPEIKERDERINQKLKEMGIKVIRLPEQVIKLESDIVSSLLCQHVR